MSKLIDSIKGDLTGKKYPSHRLIHATIERSKDPITYDLLNEYQITFGGKILAKCKPEARQGMLENVVRQIREEIYGDLKNRIIKLERAYYEEDNKTFMEQIRDINREIFGPI